MATAEQRVKARQPRLSLKALASHDGTKLVCSPHSDAWGYSYHLKDAFGTSSDDFASSLLNQLGAVVGTDPSVTSEVETNAALAAVDGLAPQNEAEAMLAAQMAATHNVAMDVLRRAKFASTMPVVQEYGSLATKLLRTYTAQLETLAKLRRGGEQKVKVEHVHVHEGGQAIVGNVTQSSKDGPGGGGGSEENRQQPHALDPASLAYAPGTPMRGADPHGASMPVPSSEKPETLPNARCQWKRSA